MKHLFINYQTNCRLGFVINLNVMLTNGQTVVGVCLKTNELKYSGGLLKLPTYEVWSVYEPTFDDVSCKVLTCSLILINQIQT